MNASLQKYLHALARLKRGGTRYGPAPHKPVLLLSLLELVGKGSVVDNRFTVSPELVGTFVENWRLLVHTAHQADFTQPLYYLQSDKAAGQPFWQLVPRPGHSIQSHIKSVHTLQHVLAYGRFSEDLFALLLDVSMRTALQLYLLDTYFPEAKDAFLSHKQLGDGFLHEVEQYVLNEPVTQLKRIGIHTEEEVFVRSGLFKRYVPHVYADTCAFTGMRLQSTFGHSFVDACHIVPFSHSHDDRVSNGLALCPNMHRAFDRGLLGVDGEYRILVSPHVREDESQAYSLAQLAGKRMLLPTKLQYWPRQEGLEWHRDEVFKG